MDLAHKLALYHKIGMPAYHLAALILFFYYPLTRETLILFVVTFLIQSFGISVGYHRLFSHRAFQANRPLTFLIALAGGLAGQGAIRRWAQHHRLHHRYTDQAGDPHSPQVNSFWYSHITWRFDPKTYAHEREAVKLWEEWPIEIVWLDRLIPALFLIYPFILYAIGGWAYVEWGCLVPIVLLWHVTFTVNSFSHYSGSRDFETPDHSRNNLWLGILMWGEGWHNNHHASPKSARFGMRWYQIDHGYWLIRLFEKCGLAQKVVTHPKSKAAVHPDHG